MSVWLNSLDEDWESETRSLSANSSNEEYSFVHTTHIPQPCDGTTRTFRSRFLNEPSTLTSLHTSNSQGRSANHIHENVTKNHKATYSANSVIREPECSNLSECTKKLADMIVQSGGVHDLFGPTNLEKLFEPQSVSQNQNQSQSILSQPRAWNEPNGEADSFVKQTDGVNDTQATLKFSKNTFRGPKADLSDEQSNNVAKNPVDPYQTLQQHYQNDQIDSHQYHENRLLSTRTASTKALNQQSLLKEYGCCFSRLPSLREGDGDDCASVQKEGFLSEDLTPIIGSQICEGKQEEQVNGMPRNPTSMTSGQASRTAVVVNTNAYSYPHSDNVSNQKETSRFQHHMVTSGERPTTPVQTIPCPDMHAGPSSPLKIFSTQYDTFTNKILNDRMARLKSVNKEHRRPITQKTMSPVTSPLRSRKRSSLDSARKQIETHGSDVIKVFPSSSIYDKSMGSPLKERTPKRVKRSSDALLVVSPSKNDTAHMTGKSISTSNAQQQNDQKENDIYEKPRHGFQRVRPPLTPRKIDLRLKRHSRSGSFSSNGLDHLNKQSVPLVKPNSILQVLDTPNMRALFHSTTSSHGVQTILDTTKSNELETQYCLTSKTMCLSKGRVDCSFNSDEHPYACSLLNHNACCSKLPKQVTARSPKIARPLPYHVSDKEVMLKIAGSVAGTVNVILPSQVEHLIPKRIGAMHFDEARQLWIKRSNSNHSLDGPAPSPSCQSNARPRHCILDTAEDDPFVGIPDLSTLVRRSDTLESRLQKCQERDLSTVLTYSSKDSSIDTEDKTSCEAGTGDDSIWLSDAFDDKCKDRSCDQIPLEFNEELNGLSNYELGSKEALPVLRTEITDSCSLQLDDTSDVSSSALSSSSNCANNEVCSYVSPGTHQYDFSSALELCHHPATPSSSAISFSPIENDEVYDINADCEAFCSSFPSFCSNYNKSSQSWGSARSRFRLAPQPSVVRRYVGRSVSKTNENPCHEMGSHLQTSARRRPGFGSLTAALPSNMFVSPQTNDEQQGVQSLMTTLKTRKANGSFFTPISDLTYQFLDKDTELLLEMSYVAQVRSIHGGSKDGQRFPIAANEILKHVTDEVPFEPNWDDLKTLTLADRHMRNLHLLSAYFPALQELDVQGNQIEYVTGVPMTVRDLKISRNCLSSMTAWSHLTNLQYLDISRNNVDSLSGLKHLLHLRELKADDNQISSIGDIIQLDGLINIKLRRNMIRALDFTAANMRRLETIDARDNMINSVMGLENLKELGSIDLEKNQISNFDVPQGTVLPALRVVRLGNNKLHRIDITAFPNIRVLYLDENALHSIQGLLKARHLDSLSIRDQKVDVVSAIPFMSISEVRKLYLSGNAIKRLEFKTDFPNLQFLELASAQLTFLPFDFGTQMSNIRILNLDYNGLSDIGSLCGMRRLKKLSLVGNRLKSLRKIANVLPHFVSLCTLDLRINPLTLGFYSPRTSDLAPDSYTSSTPSRLGARDAYDDAMFRRNMEPKSVIARRYYEVLIGEHCPRLSSLDGLEFTWNSLLQNDATWKQMVELGIVKQQKANDERNWEESDQVS